MDKGLCGEKKALLVCTVLCSAGNSGKMSQGQEAQSHRQFQPVCTFSLASLGLPGGSHRHSAWCRSRLGCKHPTKVLPPTKHLQAGSGEW